MAISGRVISFISAGGGVGKTTVALHLARMLSREHSNVLLADLDPSAGLSVLLLGDEEVVELENGEKTVGHALQNYLKRSSVRVEDYVVSVSIDGKEVGIIPGGDELTDVFGKLYSGNYRSPEQWIRKFIEDSKIIEMWDFIILDTVPFYERRYTISAFSAADNVVIVTHPYGAEPHRVKRMYNKLKTGGIDVEKKARLLINKAGKGEEGKQPEEKFKDCNIPRFNSVIPDSVYLGRVERQKNKQGMREVKTEYGRLDKHQRDKIENFYKEVKEWLGIAIIEYH